MLYSTDGDQGIREKSSQCFPLVEPVSNGLAHGTTTLPRVERFDLLLDHLPYGDRFLPSDVGEFRSIKPVQPSVLFDGVQIGVQLNV